MSFTQSTVRCNSCKKEYNVAFGIVGNTIIADGGQKDCPDCNGPLTKISDGWNAKDSKDNKDNI